MVLAFVDGKRVGSIKPSCTSVLTHSRGRWHVLLCVALSARVNLVILTFKQHSPLEFEGASLDEAQCGGKGRSKKWYAQKHNEVSVSHTQQR